MIERRVSAALRLVDGLTGKPLTASQAKVELDGQSYRCICKPDGWFIFMDLPDGEHDFRICARGFGEKKLALVASRSESPEIVLALQPARDYPGLGKVRTYELLLLDGKGKPLAGDRIYLPTGHGGAVRLAQDEAGPADEKIRLFTQRKVAQLPVPGEYLLLDGDNSELLRLENHLQEQIFSLEAPLKKKHKRGVALVHVQPYEADAEGNVFLVVQNAEGAIIYRNGKKGFSTLELTENNGIGKVEWKL